MSVARAVAAFSAMATVGLACTDAEKVTAATCAASAVVASAVDQNSVRAEFSLQLECYSQGDCCATARALTLRKEALTSNCTSKDLPVCAPSNCATAQEWAVTQPCIDKAAKENADRVCDIIAASAECLPPTCCNDPLVNNLAAANIYYDCSALMCDGKMVTASGKFTNYTSKPMECKDLPKEMEDETQRCLANLTSLAEKEPPARLTVKGTKTGTKKGTKSATGKGSTNRNSAGNCEGLHSRMKCIPDCCCESSPVAEEIRKRAKVRGHRVRHGARLR
mmetsp:Transcript_46903/g.108791  ORF Transcript_46903/g.108791 Transcript_46903/m.108791 type:complete len:279 (-) Transcript_46903:379-1215(-)